MSQQDPKKNQKNPGGANNVAAMPTKCKAEGCAKKSEKLDFCPEHFVWFKEGLLTRDGKKPVDFDRKLYYFNRRNAA